MPRKNSTSKRSSLLQNLPHQLYCERCDISITCPKRVEQKDIIDGAGVENNCDREKDEEQLDMEEPNKKQREGKLSDIFQLDMEGQDKEKLKYKDMSQLDLEEKCDLVKNILLSEAKSIFHDQEKATLKPDIGTTKSLGCDAVNTPKRTDFTALMLQPPSVSASTEVSSSS